MNPTIQLYSGGFINLKNPQPEEIKIEDIAHALANTCRFGGHCKRFYSVAEHSVLVSSLVAYPNRLAALLHDAAEAYLGDIVTPLKDLFPEFRELEKNMEWAIFEALGVDISMTPEIKMGDLIALKTERNHLLPEEVLKEEWSFLNDIPALPFDPKPIKFMTPAAAEKAFLKTYYELGGSFYG